MRRLVIVVYRPKAGKEEALLRLAQGHWSLLREENLVTGKQAMLGLASDGAVIEVFEWASAEAIEKAHQNPRVQKLWEEFGACCDFVPVGNLAEASQLFSEFATL